MSLIELRIKGISYSQSKTGAFALILEEMHGLRTLSIIIGNFEAQAITVAIEEDIQSPRPLTHDLFKSFAENFAINIKKIEIHKFIDGVFFSNIVCEKNGLEVLLDSRTSDAIAIAARFDTPIYTSEEILREAGIILKGKENTSFEEKLTETLSEVIENITADEKEDIITKSIKELQKLLAQAVSNEDYEAAATLRDEIEKRS